MAKAPTKKQVEADDVLLKQIVDGTRSEAQCSTAKAADVVRLAEAGLIETGGDAENGEIYVRATATGMAKFPLANVETANSGNTDFQEDDKTMSDVQVEASNETAVKAPRKAPVMVDASSISTGMGLPPTGKRGGGAGRKSVYPFETLGAPNRDAAGNLVGASYFFVPATPDRPEPARVLNATVSAANKKAKENGPAADTGIVKEFKVYADAENGVDGAKVFRIA